MTTSRSAGAEHFDCVVVGTGFGGSVTAQRLADAGRRVLVLERGQALPARVVPAQPDRLQAQPLGPERGPARAVRPVVVLRPRRARLERARRRLADLRERPAAQGREVVRVARAPGRRRRGLAAAPRGPRAALRPRRAGDRRPALSARARAVRPHGEDARLQGRRRGARAGLVPPAARRHLRATRASRRPSGEPIEEERPNLHGRPRADLPARAASATWAATTAPRTRSTTRTSPTRGTPARRSARAARCASSSRARAAAGPSTTSSTRAEREGTKTQTQSLPRVTVTTDELVLAAGTLGTTYLLLRNRAALPGLSPRLGEGFSRQRRPADLRLALHGRRHGRRAGAAADRRRLRPGDHQRRARRRTSSTATAARAAASTSRTRAIRSSSPGCSRSSTRRARSRGRCPSSCTSRARTSRAGTRTSAPRPRTCSATATCPPARSRCSSWAGTCRTG